MIKIITLILFLFTFFTSSNSEVISKIEIKGNKRISNDTFAVFGGFKIGDDLSNKDLNKLLKELYETNFFKNIDVVLNNGILKISVVENPIIQLVEINGIRSKPLNEKIIENYTRFIPKMQSETYIAIVYILLGILIVLALEWYGKKTRKING